MLSGWMLSVGIALVALQEGSDPLPDAPRLPSDLRLQEDGPEEYRFTCDYLQTDADDAFLRKQRIEATYVRALPDGQVEWRDVRIATAAELEQPFPPGVLQEYMAGFRYSQAAGAAQFLPTFFKGFPATPEASYGKNLVWDTHMLESFGQGYFDELRLNEPYPLASSDVPLAGLGAFRNRAIELTWIGSSEWNGEPCALVQYEAFFNRFQMAFGSSQMHGLSHYWGTIWVSLADKQIESATLNEHVSLRIGGADGAQERASVLRVGRLVKTSR